MERGEGQLVAGRGPLAPKLVPPDASSINSAGEADWQGFEALASYMLERGHKIWTQQQGPFHFDARAWIEEGDRRGGKENGGDTSKEEPKASNRRIWSKVRSTRGTMDAMLEAAWGLLTYKGKPLIGKTDVLLGGAGWSEGGNDRFYKELPNVTLLDSQVQLVKVWLVGRTKNKELVHVALCCAKALSATSLEEATAWAGYWHWVECCMRAAVDGSASPQVRRQASVVFALLAPSHRIRAEVLAVCMQSSSLSSPSASAICSIDEGLLLLLLLRLMRCSLSLAVQSLS